MKVLVIGAGASGMMAALTAAETPCHQVVLLERQNRVGRKLMATGNGRCNLSNHHISPDRYHGTYASFVRPALEYFTAADTVLFFQRLGLLTVSEDSGRIYPFSDHANSVVDVLRFALNERHIDLQCGCEVISIKKKASGFHVAAADKDFFCDKLILACGGSAGSKLGGTDLGYRLLRSVGHEITALHPSLVQLRTDTFAIRGLKGIRTEAGLTLKRSGRTVLTHSGEVQFTDFGISGPAIFEISRQITGHEETLLLDLLPLWTEKDLLVFFQSRVPFAKELPGEELLSGTLHNRLGKVVLKNSGIEIPAVAAQYSPDQLRQLVHSIKFFPLVIRGTMGMDQAQVTAGGACTKQFRPDTMESRICPGLFAAGELLDVDGDCGGFNLQWAWSSGRVAGKLGNL